MHYLEHFRLYETTEDYTSKFIRAAVDDNDPITVKELLHHHDVNPAVYGDYAIRLATEQGNTEVVKILLTDPRVDPAVSNNYPIRAAARYNNIKLVKALMSNPKVDPSAQYNYALKWAIEYKHIDVIKLLLQDERVIKNLNEITKLTHSDVLDEVLIDMFDYINTPKDVQIFIKLQ